MPPLSQVIQILNDHPPENPEDLRRLYEIQQTAINVINTHEGVLSRCNAIFLADRSVYLRAAFVSAMIGSMVFFTIEIGSLKIDEQETVHIEKEKLKKLFVVGALFGISIGSFLSLDLKDIGDLIRVRTHRLAERVQRLFF